MHSFLASASVEASHSKRFFLILALLALSFVSASCHSKSSSGVFLDPAFGPLIPPDTKYMIGLRLDKIRETPLYKQLNGQFDLNKRLDVFSARTGLDPRKDIWQVLMVSNGSDALFLARGRFGVGEMEPQLNELGGQRIKYKNYTLIGNEQTSVVFANPGVAIAGKQASLKNLLDHRAEWAQPPAVLLAQLKTLPAADQIWMAGNGDFSAFQSSSGSDATGMRSFLSNFLSYIKAGQLGVHVDEGAELKADVQCVSAEGAQRVRDALKGMVGLARLNTRNDQLYLLKLYDTVKVNQSASQVDMEAQVSSDLVGPLLQSLPQVKVPATIQP